MVRLIYPTIRESEVGYAEPLRRAQARVCTAPRAFFLALLSLTIMAMVAIIGNSLEAIIRLFSLLAKISPQNAVDRPVEPICTSRKVHEKLVILCCGKMSKM
jgi:hypothetical protein